MPLQALDTVAGFEPTSVPFTQGCFTIKLHRNKSHYTANRGIAFAPWLILYKAPPIIPRVNLQAFLITERLIKTVWLRRTESNRQSMGHEPSRYHYFHSALYLSLDYAYIISHIMLTCQVKYEFVLGFRYKNPIAQIGYTIWTPFIINNNFSIVNTHFGMKTIEFLVSRYNIYAIFILFMYQFIYIFKKISFSDSKQAV